MCPFIGLLNLNVLGILVNGYIFKGISITLCQYLTAGTGMGQSFHGVHQAAQRLKSYSNHFVECTQYSHVVPYFLST
jgi:hypothetical protein